MTPCEDGRNACPADGDISRDGLAASTMPLPTLSLAELAASDSDSDLDNEQLFPGQQISKPARAKQKDAEHNLDPGRLVDSLNTQQGCTGLGRATTLSCP